MGFLSNKIWVRIFLGHPVYCTDVGGIMQELGHSHRLGRVSALSGTEKVAWNAFRDMAHNFLGNAKAPKYIEFVEHMMDS